MKPIRPLVTLLALSFIASACSDAPREGELLAFSGDSRARAASAASAASPDTGALPVLRRVAAARSGDHDYATGRPSRDGRYLAYVDWTTGDVALHDFEEDRSRLLTNKGSWGEDGSWAENAVFSPDGRRVVFLYGNVGAAEDANFLYELRIIGVDGSGERVLREATREELFYLPTDWHEERGILLERNFRGGPVGPADLVTLDPESGEVSVIFEAGAGEPHPHLATFSPDGGLVAAQMGEGVVVIDLSGREIARASWGHLVGWRADGGGVVTYGRDRRGETGFWHLPFGGDALGAPELLRSAVYGARPIGTAGDRYYYTVGVDAPQVHVGTLDLRTGEILAPPSPVGTAVEGGTQWPAWSPDGRSLAYLRNPAGSRRVELMLRSADGTEVRRVTELDQPGVRRLRWDPAGDALYFEARDGEQFALFRVELGRGSVARVVEGVGQGYAISPDGERAYVRRVGDAWWGGRNGISAVDLASGDDLWFVATGAEPGNQLGVTPDGSGILATVERGGSEELVVLRSQDGRELRSLARVARPDFISPNGTVAAMEGEEVVYMVWNDAEQERELWAVPLEGGETRLVMEGVDSRPALHPDGRRFAVQRGDWRHEIWVMEGVQAALAGR